MSIATEITRLQGIKTDIRTALVTQGVAQASSHNMADFSADILAIQGGSEGVYITVTCDSAYQGYNIILSANEIELDRKQCPSSLEVNFFVSADDVTLPATFTISNSLNDITTSVIPNIYGWYDTELSLIVALVPKMTSNTTCEGSELCGIVTASNYVSPSYAYNAFDQDLTTNWSAKEDKGYIQYEFNSIKTIKNISYIQMTQKDINDGAFPKAGNATIQLSKDGSTYNDVGTIQFTSDRLEAYKEKTVNFTPQTAKFVRIKFNSANKGYSSYNYNCFGELQIYGY